MRIKILLSLLFRFGLTAIYLFTIQYLTQVGGKISVKLIKNEDNESKEKRADSLVYKVYLTESFMYILFLKFRQCFTDLISLPGVWSVFYAIVYRSFLPCSFTS